ncbi:loricrin-like [Stylophora pistillata]|uniref:loricrin-like n=1 Tax=Stylophora pistillata TaxID=50429 RepID=UPI000C0434BB|nr:loricrin-like [Stylophora pistillata]
MSTTRDWLRRNFGSESKISEHRWDFNNINNWKLEKVLCIYAVASKKLLITLQWGPGGYNAGGGGRDSAVNNNDSAGGGGGGGHFSGDGGGDGGTGCTNKEGTASTVIGTYTGGGGVARCPGGDGGDGGQQGQPVQGKYVSAYGGTSGTESRGGEGGQHLTDPLTDFTKRQGYSGGGGGRGGSAINDDHNPGGRGGNGGGLVYLLVGELTLDGKIESKGQSGECLNMKAHRSAPGDSGAGGNVVIITKSLNGNPNNKIEVEGGIPVDCAFGTGGGKLNPLSTPPHY